MAVTKLEKIENTLKYQLIISTLILTPVIVLLSLYGLPDAFSFVTGDSLFATITFESSNKGVMVCALSGLFSGLIIGFFTDYFTSNAHSPTRSLADACVSGAAINIIQGLALGYLSCIIPILAIAGILYS